MSMQSYEQAKQLINARPDLCDFLGPQTEALLNAAENAVGVKFSDTYKRFLLEYGAGSVGSTVIYGLVNESFNNPGTPDVVWHTLTTRDEVEFPSDYIIIYSLGDGEVFCLITLSTGESPVIAFTPGLPIALQAEEIVAEDFGDFFLKQVQHAVAKRARSEL